MDFGRNKALKSALFIANEKVYNQRIVKIELGSHKQIYKLIYYIRRTFLTENEINRTFSNIMRKTEHISYDGNPKFHKHFYMYDTNIS